MLFLTRDLELERAVIPGLQRHGYECVIVRNLDELYSVGSEGEIGIVAIDDDIVELDAVEACSGVKEACAAPIIVLSTHDTLTVRDLVRRAGASLFMFKPFAVAELKDALGALIG